MFDRTIFTAGKIVLTLSVLLLAANGATAYVGPGADVAFIGQFLALLGLIAAACTSILLWPIYALLRKIRGVKKEEDRAANRADS